MADSRPYEIRLAKSASKQLRGLPAAEQQRIKTALRDEARRVASPGSGRGGKAVKSLRGRHDSFDRLRVGSWRVLFELDHGTATLLVLAVIARRDLDRWLRSR